MFVLGSFTVSIAAACFLCLVGHKGIGTYICLVLLCALLSLSYIAALVSARVNDKTLFDGTSYRYFFFAVVVMWAVVIASSFFSEFLYPAVFTAMIFAAFPVDSLSLGICIFSDVILFISQDYTSYVLGCYVCLSFAGFLLAKTVMFDRLAHRIPGSLSLAAIQMGVPSVFIYLTYHKLYFSLIEKLGIISAVVLFTAPVIPYFIKKFYSRQKENFYDSILDPEFPLMQELKLYSDAEYQHAQRVSALSAACAREIGVDEDVAAAAGMYYRIGKINGGPEVDSALMLTSRYNFPNSIKRILYEYDGILRKPSTRESAIVHMCSNIVKKIEFLALESNRMDSHWNQEMVIYQTVNELSSSGIYDESGLSINQFLKIRDRLAKEDNLL